jgi:hypothetical protein
MSVAQNAATACPDSAGFMELASKAAGLTDFGDPRLQAPLDALVNSFRKDAWPKMTPGAQAYAVRTLTDNLVGRLKVVEDRKRHPEIAQVEVRRPFIVIGPPRSGSTLLHTMLSLDPEAIATPYWVCLEPSPPPRLGGPSPERLESTQAKLTSFLDLVPQMKVMHSYFVEEGASALGEDGYDIMVMAQTSKGLYYSYALDSYREYLLSADHAAALDFHHGFLQHVGWGSEDKHFALKAADHLVWLRELHARYPDAQLLWTHRDLAEQLSSCASVFIASRSLSGPVRDEDKPALAADAVELERRIYHHGMQAREALGEDRFFDVNYHEMIADPVKVIAGIYARFGRDVSPAYVDAIEGWVRENPQTKHGVHQHRARDFGIDPETVNRQFKAYTDRYGFGFEIRP